MTTHNIINKRKHIEHAHDAYIDSFFLRGDISVKNLLLCTLVGLSAVGINGSCKLRAIGLLLIVTIPAEGKLVSSDSLKIASDDLKDISDKSKVSNFLHELTKELANWSPHLLFK